MAGACNDQDSLQCMVHLKYSSISHPVQSSLKLYDYAIMFKD